VGFDPLVSVEESREFGVEWLHLEELWPISDYITLHTPLIPQTKCKSQDWWVMWDRVHDIWMSVKLFCFIALFRSNRLNRWRSHCYYALCQIIHHGKRNKLSTWIERVTYLYTNCNSPPLKHHYHHHQHYHRYEYDALSHKGRVTLIIVRRLNARMLV